VKTFIQGPILNIFELPRTENDFSSKNIPPGTKSAKIRNSRDQNCKFPKLLRFFTKGLNMTTYDFKRTFGDNFPYFE
jgi:hypothetical protein